MTARSRVSAVAIYITCSMPGGILGLDAQSEETAELVDLAQWVGDLLLIDRSAEIPKIGHAQDCHQITKLSKSSFKAAVESILLNYSRATGEMHAVGGHRMWLISKHVQFALTGTDVKLPNWSRTGRS